MPIQSLRAKIVHGIQYVLLYCVFKPYYLSRASWPVWFYILNTEGRRLYKTHRRNPSDAVRRVITEYQKNGLAIAHLDDLFPGENMLGQLQEYANSLASAAHARVRENKPFLVRFEALEPYAVIDMKSPLMRLAFRDQIFDVVNAYLGMFSKFFFYSLEETLPISHGVDPVKSQRWHRDPEDKKICKVFVYLNDVDETAGPFTYVLQSQHGGQWRATLPPRPPTSYYPPVGEVEKRIPKEYIKTCTGKAGSIVFADTSGLHRGGFATAKSRLMITLGYGSKALLIPLAYTLPEGFDREKKLNPAQAYALDTNVGWLLRRLNSVTQFIRTRGFMIEY